MHLHRCYGLGLQTFHPLLNSVKLGRDRINDIPNFYFQLLLALRVQAVKILGEKNL